MRVSPIPFSTAMAAATWGGWKTATRRVIPHHQYLLEDFKGKPNFLHHRSCPNYCDYACGGVPFDDTGRPNERGASPYGDPGDLLWVREPWSTLALFDGYKPSDMPPETVGNIRYHADGIRGSGRYRHARFMPRAFSRQTLRISDIRVERLQEIGGEDAEREGLRKLSKDGTTYKFGIADSDCLPGTDDFGWPWREWNTDAIAAFRRLWDSINAQRGFGWETNPWVWVIEFEVIKANVDEVFREAA